MRVIEKPMLISMESVCESEYRTLLNEYFSAAERNSRASSITEKKQIMAIKEKMSSLCNRNPEKVNRLKTIIAEARANREKTVVITKSSSVAAELLELLSEDEGGNGVLNITSQLSVHEVNDMIGRFNKTPEATVLLVTDAVSTGLDVTAANHLVHYDYPARYADLLQRNNRITRQTSHHVQATIYYLATSGKIDEFDYLECTREKTSLERVRSTV